MRRDYFSCVFLLYVAVSLAFVCILPTYFAYGEIIEREIGLIERIASLLISIGVILVIPIISAIKKKFWVSFGAAAYGLLAYIPGMMLSKMDAVLSGSGANTFSVVKAFLLRAIYIMVNAPYVGISKLVGNNFALVIPKLILPVSIITYVLVQLFRFYRDAYVAEQLSPVSDKTHKVENTRAVSREPEILGTVISAPVKKPVAPATTATPAPAVNSNQNPAAATIRAPEQNPQLKAPNVIQIAPTPSSSSVGGETRVINLGAPVNPQVKPQAKPQADKPIQLGAPVNPVTPAAPTTNTRPSNPNSGAIPLGAPKSPSNTDNK